MKRRSQRSTRAQGPGPRQSRWFLLAAAGFAAALLLVGRLPSSGAVDGAHYHAVLIDQLSAEIHNPVFRAAVAADIEHFGLSMDVYEGEAVDVDLYRSVGELDCGLLLIRSHSGMLELEEAGEQKTTALFTNEPYAQYKHVAEQLNQRVLIVRPFEGDRKLTFGVTPSFFRKSMRGQLPNTIVVVAGCSILADTDLAQALIDRGASAVISWDRSVGLQHADEATALLVQHLFAGKMTVAEATLSAIAAVGPDPEFGAVLTYYPTTAGDRTARQLLAG